MTNLQKIRLRLSKVRVRLNEIAGLEGDALTTEIRSEADTLHTEYSELETRHQAAIVAEGESKTTPVEADTEKRERLELRGRATLTNFLVAAARGRRLDGPEAELAQAAGVGNGSIPLELFDTAEAREALEARAVTSAPGTVGVNLSLFPAVFAGSVAPRLGIEMPRVESGSYTTARIDTSLTAAAQAKSGVSAASAATWSVVTATPKRVSARLEVLLEDIAAVGAANFESILRENLSMALADALDTQMLTGNSNAPNLTGILQRLTDATRTNTAADGFDEFVEVSASGIDGLWAASMGDIAVVTNPQAFRLAATAFRGTDGEMAASAYLAAQTGGFWTNKRMPTQSGNYSSGILYRGGRPGIRRAVCPHWNEISIDDIYSGAASAQRNFQMHVLLGDVILIQPDAYAEVRYRTA